ncbi:unnamed protein product [Urochloa humidicola]
MGRPIPENPSHLLFPFSFPRRRPPLSARRRLLHCPLPFSLSTHRPCARRGRRGFAASSHKAQHRICAQDNGSGARDAAGCDPRFGSGDILAGLLSVVPPRLHPCSVTAAINVDGKDDHTPMRMRCTPGMKHKFHVPW